MKRAALWILAGLLVLGCVYSLLGMILAAWLTIVAEPQLHRVQFVLWGIGAVACVAAAVVLVRWLRRTR